MIDNQGNKSKIPKTAQGSKEIAKSARDWVASPEGRRDIETALLKARKLTVEVNKSQLEAIESLRVTFNV